LIITALATLMRSRLRSRTNPTYPAHRPTTIRTRRTRRASLRAAATLTGILGLSLAAGQIGAAPTAHAAAGGLRYVRGYSVQGSWLCYGWSSGMFHCTQRWHRGGSRLVSDNPAWVPNVGGIARAPVGAGSARPTGFAGSAPANIGPWMPPPGRFAFGMRDFAGDPYGAFFGECTWYAWLRHSNEPLMRMGNAGQWAFTARAFGLRTGSVPAAGATVVFQPGVQGASGLGHAAHVEAVYGNGWFLVSEMSFFWNGGGWGRVSFRYAHVGWGVTFIY
jgi:hypothetical protein